jgi:DNA-binding transcriptional regulator YiaG
METASLAADLRAWRDRLGLTQAQAAAMLGVPYGTLRAWETSRAPDHPDMVRHAMRAIERDRAVA